MPKTTSKPASRECRLSIRIDEQRKQVIEQAAASQGTTISDFVIDTAYNLAKVLMVDEQPLSLNKKQVAAIFDTLDNPPPEKVAAIRKLLSEPSILDG